MTEVIEKSISLKDIAAATRSRLGYTFVPLEVAQKFPPSLIEYDTNIRNTFGHVAIRCSAIGLWENPLDPIAEEPAFLKAQEAAVAESDIFGKALYAQIQKDSDGIAAELVLRAIKIAPGIPIPSLTPRPGRVAKDPYRFTEFSVYDSIFIPGGDYKKLSSTVSNANKKHAPKKFVIRSVADGAPWSYPGMTGAGIWRVEDTQPE